MVLNIISGIITAIVTILSLFSKMKDQAFYNIFSNLKFLGKELLLSSFLTIILYPIFFLIFLFTNDKNIIVIVAALLDLIILFVATIMFLYKRKYLNRHAMEIANDLKIVREHNKKAYDEIDILNRKITSHRSQNKDYDEELQKLKAIELESNSKRTNKYLWMMYFSGLLIPSIFMFLSVLYAIEQRWMGVLFFIVVTILTNTIIINEDANILFRSKVKMTNKMNKKHIAKYDRQKNNKGWI